MVMVRHGGKNVAEKITLHAWNNHVYGGIFSKPLWKCVYYIHECKRERSISLSSDQKMRYGIFLSLSRSFSFFLFFGSFVRSFIENWAIWSKHTIYCDANRVQLNKKALAQYTKVCQCCLSALRICGKNLDAILCRFLVICAFASHVRLCGWGRRRIVRAN